MRGSLHKLRLAERPPHPDPLSPQAGRGSSLPLLRQCAAPLRMDLFARYHCCTLTQSPRVLLRQRNSVREGDANMRKSLSTSIMVCLAFGAGVPVHAANVTYERLV